MRVQYLSLFIMMKDPTMVCLGIDNNGSRFTIHEFF